MMAFVLTDGFDLGVGILLPFVAKSEMQKRVAINSIGPIWESNQVWLVLGAGAVFAAWPLLYALVFSTLYIPFLIALISLILRPVSLDFRGKIDKRWWRIVWDTGLFVAGFFPAFLFGVVIGNMLTGINFTFDEFMVIRNGDTSLCSFLSPFAILCGLTTLLVIIMHGASFLQLRTEAEVRARCSKLLKIIPAVIALLFVAGGFYAVLMNSFHIVGVPRALDFVNHKVVEVRSGGWLDNYILYPALCLMPLSAIMGLLVNWLASILRRYRTAFIASGITIIGMMSTIGITTFPFLMPSKTDPSSSLTVWDASSSHYTLVVMMFAALVLLPIIFSYVSYVYYIVRHKVTELEIQNSSKTLY